LLSILLGLQLYTAGSFFKGTFMDIFAQFATDPNLELEGVWVDIGPADKDGKVPRLKIARSGNKRHGRIISQQYEASKSLLELKNDASDAKGEEITIDAMAKAILLDWQNLSYKGVPVKDGWNYEQAKTFLAHRDFRDLVNKHSNEFKLYQAAQDKADAGN
jgi:hypothetical protein